MQKILMGVAYLHDKRILHGWIDPINIAFKNANNDFFQLCLYNFEQAIDMRLLVNGKMPSKFPNPIPTGES